MECSGVSSLRRVRRKSAEVGDEGVHGCTVMRTQKAYSFLRNFGELEERDHLKADSGVSAESIVQEIDWITHPPLSATISLQL